jgi:hypothetical protein
VRVLTVEEQLIKLVDIAGRIAVALEAMVPQQTPPPAGRVVTKLDLAKYCKDSRTATELWNVLRKDVIDGMLRRHDLPSIRTSDGELEATALKQAKASTSFNFTDVPGLGPRLIDLLEGWIDSL